jgi:hypothetical protein
MAVASSTRNSAAMPGTISQSQLAVLPLESSIPPEMTLHEWRYRHVTPSASRPSRFRAFIWRRWLSVDSPPEPSDV